MTLVLIVGLLMNAVALPLAAGVPLLPEQAAASASTKVTTLATSQAVVAASAPLTTRVPTPRRPSSSSLAVCAGSRETSPRRRSE